MISLQSISCKFQQVYFDMDSTRHMKIQEDWTNREFLDVLTNAISKMTSFLTEFEASFRYRVTTLNEKLTHLQRRLDYVEARMAVTDR